MNVSILISKIKSIGTLSSNVCPKPNRLMLMLIVEVQLLSGIKTKSSTHLEPVVVR